MSYPVDWWYPWRARASQVHPSDNRLFLIPCAISNLQVILSCCHSSRYVFVSCVVIVICFKHFTSWMGKKVKKKRQNTISSFTICWIFTQFEDWEQVTCWFAPCRIWLLPCDMWHVTCDMSHLPIVPPEQSDSLETPAPDVVVPGRSVLHHLPDEVHVAGEVRTSKGPFNSPLLVTDLSINLDPTLPNTGPHTPKHWTPHSQTLNPTLPNIGPHTPKHWTPHSQKLN